MIILSEVSQRKTYIIWYHLYVESKKIQMRLYTKQKQIHRHRKQTYGSQRRQVGGRVKLGVWELYVYTLVAVAVQLLSSVPLFVTTWSAACQDSLSFTVSLRLLKLMSIEPVKPSNHLTLCHPLLFLPSVFLSIRVFSNESAQNNRWPKYWSFSFSTNGNYFLTFWGLSIHFAYSVLCCAKDFKFN